MDRKTFFGAINKLVISHIAISKSICGNLNNLVRGRKSMWAPCQLQRRGGAYRLKKRGMRKLSCRVVPPKLEGPPCCLGIEIWGFMGVAAVAGNPRCWLKERGGCGWKSGDVG